MKRCRIHTTTRVFESFNRRKRAVSFSLSHSTSRRARNLSHARITFYFFVDNCYIRTCKKRSSRHRHPAPLFVSLRPYFARGACHENDGRTRNAIASEISSSSLRPRDPSSENESVICPGPALRHHDRRRHTDPRCRRPRPRPHRLWTSST